jgi:AAA domain-containing protein/DnaB helicase-like protein/Homeodomain-like domain-containing protein
MTIDRPLPNKAEAERAILGTILINEKVLRVAEQHLSSSDFSIRAHGRVFAEMQRFAGSGQPIELVTLCDALQQDPEVAAVGGVPFVAALGDGVYKNAPVETWAKSIRDAALLRQVAHSAESLRESAMQPGARLEDITAKVEMLGKSLASRLQSGGRLLVAVPVEELLTREIKSREMILDPILPEQGLAMLYAYRGIGKTFLALGMAATVASGARFLRWKAARSRRVLYVDGELPAATLRERLAMILAGVEDSEPPRDMLRIITPDLQDRPMPDLATAEGQRFVEPHLEEVGMLVLDNLSSLCRDGNENEGEGWLPVQEWALGLRRRGLSVLFVHHAGKNKSQRGTSRREDLLDTVITLKHPSDYNPTEGLRCEVHFEKTRSMLGDAAKPFEVKLESGPDGRAVWSYRELEDAKAEQAAAMYSAQMTVRDVAEELGISRSQAGRLRQKWMAAQSFDVSRRPLV